MKGVLLFTLCLLGTALSKQLITPRGVEIKPREYSPLECGSTDTLHYGEFAVIESPNYGKKGRKGKYPNNFECTWDIEIPASSELLFWCEYFNVKRGDYLYIFDQGYYGVAKDGFSFDPMTSPDETATLNLRFKSNKKKNGRGFRCFIESEPQGFSNSTTTTTQEPVTTTVDNG